MAKHGVLISVPPRRMYVYLIIPMAIASEYKTESSRAA